MQAQPMSRSPFRLARALGVVIASLALAATAAVPAGAADGTSPAGDLVEVVSARFPATNPTNQQSAVRAADVLAGARTEAPALVDGPANPWETVTTLPGVVKDIDMVNRKIGYAAAELGVIWKTMDGGDTWQKLVDVGFPIYFYGVAALSKDEVVVSGFDNAAGFVEAALVWRTTDGGATWSSDIGMDPYWGGRVRFAKDDQHGVIAGLIGSTIWHTSTGGETEDEWAFVQPDVDNGWFGNQFTLLNNLRTYASGIKYCTSPDAGASWACQPSVDEVFDGPTEFKNRKIGWVGGGSISPAVEGWLHRTSDGGTTWSDRVLQVPYPIRQVEGLNKKDVLAVGGNGPVGGINYSTDGGATWSEDYATDTEVTACDQIRIKKGAAKRVLCFGFSSAGGWHSDLYLADIARH